MSEAKTLSKFRQKKPKNLAHKTKDTEDKAVSDYFYPKNNLYTRQEFELLDTIYSDEPVPETTENKQPVIIDNFWPQNKEEYLTQSPIKNNALTNIGWFTSGVMLTSVIWLIYFQLSVHEIKAKHETQIVFNKSAELMTDKTADKEMTKSLKTNTSIQNNKTGLFKFSFPQIFSKKNVPIKEESNVVAEQAKVVEPIQVKKEEVPITSKENKTYTVKSGDSLWIIAKKVYSDPSPLNIEKIAKANKLRLTSTLSLGQKLVVPE